MEARIKVEMDYELPFIKMRYGCPYAYKLIPWLIRQMLKD